MIRNLHVKQLVNDDFFSEATRLRQQLFVETETSGGRAACPLPPHWSDMDLFGPDADPLGPRLDFFLECVAGDGTRLT